MKSRDAQISAVGKLVQAADQTEKLWLDLIPTESMPVAGKLRIAPLILLADQCAVGGAVWLQQRLFGFPLVGRLSQHSCYPDKLKEARKHAEPIKKIMKTNFSRFQDSASKSGRVNAKALRGEALTQCEKGWLARPFPLCRDRRPCTLHNPELNVSFRFGVEESDNLRACDDLRRARTNLACAVETPIKLARWGHLEELPNQANGKERERERERPRFL